MDLHRITAAEVFNVDADEVTSEQRRYVKILNYGLVYGTSRRGLELSHTGRAPSSPAVQSLASAYQLAELKRLITPAPDADYSALEVLTLRSVFGMPPPWRVEGRSNPFVPWRVMQYENTIENASAACAVLKKRHHLYSVRVRCNFTHPGA